METTQDHITCKDYTIRIESTRYASSRRTDIIVVRNHGGPVVYAIEITTRKYDNNEYETIINETSTVNLQSVKTGAHYSIVHKMANDMVAIYDTDLFDTPIVS